MRDDPSKGIEVSRYPIASLVAPPEVIVVALCVRSEGDLKLCQHPFQGGSAQDCGAALPEVKGSSRLRLQSGGLVEQRVDALAALDDLC